MTAVASAVENTDKPLQTLTFKLMPKIDDSIKSDIVRWSAFYEHRIKTGSKVIFHLEAFVAKFMRVYEG